MLKECTLWKSQRDHHWPGVASTKTNLWGSAEDLKTTVKFVEATGLFI